MYIDFNLWNERYIIIGVIKFNFTLLIKFY
jgi:hypothetical protein